MRNPTPLSLFLQVEGCRLHVESLGQGPPLLLLHSGGAGYESGVWDEGCRALAGHYRLWRYERAGYGLSSPRQAFGWGFFEQEERMLAALRTRLGLGPGLAVIGTSDGGTIALMHAARHPGSLAALVVEGAHGDFEPSMALELDRRYRRFLEKHPGAAADSRPGDCRLPWFEGFRDPRWRGWTILPELAAITCPVLVVQGDQDAFVRASHAQRLAQAMPGAQAVILPQSRHLCHRSNPAAFYPLVAGFLEEHIPG
jgi:pimeloyl-ACP methyl ester carboxylesterase